MAAHELRKLEHANAWKKFSKVSLVQEMEEGLVPTSTYIDMQAVPRITYVGQYTLSILAINGWLLL